MIVSRIRLDRGYWELVEIAPAVMAKAEEIVLNVKVRTLDAIHIASAVTFLESTGRPLPFLTSDERQLEAADKCGLEVIRVGR